MNWAEHFQRASKRTEFGSEFSGGRFGGSLEGFNEEATAVEQEIIDAPQAELPEIMAADKPIELTGLQKLQQVVMQTTGQLNAAGTAPGPGFFGTTLGYVVMGVGGLAGLYFLSNIASVIPRK